MQCYRGMSEQLRKVEEAVLGSVAGSAPALALYYAHWERALLHALGALTVGGITSLLRMLDPEGPPQHDPALSAPLFEVCMPSPRTPAAVRIWLLAEPDDVWCITTSPCDQGCPTAVSCTACQPESLVKYGW